MGGIRKKKFQSGEAAKYISRRAVLKKLQLSLKDFRKICILKGIYPREPDNRKKAQKGDTTKIKIMYAKKDIRFLMHEPVIERIRQSNAHFHKITRAKSLYDGKKVKKLLRTYPKLSLDQIVKERYPTFLSALRDLDDCLTLCFLYSTFPTHETFSRDQPHLCRRLTFEFLHAVIASQSLRKVFVSIKGYYFQAEIKGQTITWIVPHNFGFQPQSRSDVDYRVMSTFVQFYTELLGFVNFKLYHWLNLYYPPRIALSEMRNNDLVDKESYNSERVAALNVPLARSAGNPEIDEEEELQIDVFESGTDEAAILETKKKAEEVKKLKTLFKGLRIYINREVPQLPVVFTLKCFGAEVSWDKDFFVGAKFDETDETITHQIIDRPMINKQYISRYYVQPQWVFDSVNAKKLLPVEKYFIGVTLPPHLSPFVDPEEFGRDNYLPPEQIQLVKQMNGEEDAELVIPKRKNRKKKKKKVQEEESGSDDDDNKVSDKKNSETPTVKNNEEAEEINDKEAAKNSETPTVKNNEKAEEINDKEAAAEKLREKLKRKMKVAAGKVIAPDPLEASKAEYQEYKLREKMVPNKYRRLYSHMMKAKANRKLDKNILEQKRIKLEKEKKKEFAAE